MLSSKSFHHSWMSRKESRKEYNPHHFQLHSKDANKPITKIDQDVKKTKASFKQSVTRGKHLTRKLIIKDYKAKFQTCELLLDLQSRSNNNNDNEYVYDGSSIILKTQGVCVPETSPHSTLSLQASPPSIMDEIPNDPYYTRKFAPLFDRPKWRARRVMVNHNKWRRRRNKNTREKKTRTTRTRSNIVPENKQRVYW